MSDQRSKPTGHTGPFEVEYDDNRLQVRWKTVPFPRTKEDVENFVVRGFLRQCAAEGILPDGLQATQNETDDFDFQIVCDDRRRYLELMELAPLENFAGGYASAAGAYKPYELARTTVNKVLRKSSRYAGVARESSVLLLLYLTHWTFIPNDTTIALMQYWCCMESHCFEAIYFYRPIDESAGNLSTIHPTPRQHWAGVDPEACRDDVVYNLLPAGVQVDEEGRPALVFGTTPGQRRNR